MHFAALLLLAAALAQAQPSRQVLFVTHSAGFRHGSIEEARRTFDRLRSPTLAVRWTEDVSLLSESGLAGYDAVFFFTSGELPMSAEQRAALLAFVRDGGGFGGAHSATDTFYTWPEYGELIGGYFDGHPWTQTATVDVEDPDHPATRPLPASFRILEEFYQFRAWDRRTVRVLLTLDSASVDLRAEGVHRDDRDFALAWCHEYGKGRVFYTALGHFDETWRDARFESMLRGAVLWLVGDAPANAAPRHATPALDRLPPLAPGALVELTGSGLTTGSVAAGTPDPVLPSKLVGTSVRIGSFNAPLLAVSPDRVALQVPFDAPVDQPVELAVRAGGSAARVSARLMPVAPRVVGVGGEPPVISIFATGLGAVSPPAPAGAFTPLSHLIVTNGAMAVMIRGVEAPVEWSGLAPGLLGVYQLNVRAAAVPALSDIEISAR